jgi:hypothetical protein
MKKISAFSILLILFACSSKSSMPVYQGDGFSVSYPKGWTVNSTVEKALVRISAPEELASSTLAPAVTVSSGNNRVSGSDLTEESLALLKESVPEFNFISQDTVKAGGKKCDRLTFSGNLASARMVWSLLIYDGKKTDYFVSCTAPFDIFESNSGIFTEIQKSFNPE